MYPPSAPILRSIDEYTAGPITLSSGESHLGRCRVANSSSSEESVASDIPLLSGAMLSIYYKWMSERNIEHARHTMHSNDPGSELTREYGGLPPKHPNRRRKMVAPGPRRRSQIRMRGELKSLKNSRPIFVWDSCKSFIAISSALVTRTQGIVACAPRSRLGK